MAILPGQSDGDGHINGIPVIGLEFKDPLRNDVARLQRFLDRHVLRPPPGEGGALGLSVDNQITY
jgi:hypothetical protein